jgi:hypothetical protein
MSQDLHCTFFSIGLSNAVAAYLAIYRSVEHSTIEVVSAVASCGSIAAL